MPKKLCKQDSKSAWWHHFLLRREEKERVTAKNSKQAESTSCTKNRTHLCTSWQFHLITHYYPCNQQDLCAPSLFGKFYLHRNDCWPILTWGIQAWQSGHIALQSNSWASPWLTHGPFPTDKPLTWLFCSYFYSRFTRTLATTRPDVLFIVHTKILHYGQNTKLYTLPPPSAIRNEVIKHSWRQWWYTATL